MSFGTIYFKNGTSIAVSDSSATSLATALDTYWTKPDGGKRVIRQAFTSTDNQNRVITVDLESVMCIVSG